MKIFSKAALFSLSVLFILSGCKDEPVPDSLSVAPDALTEIVAEGQTQEITVKSTVKWTVSGTTDWVKVTPSTGNAGEAKVSINVLPNEKGDKRNATLEFRGGNLSQKVTIEQVGAVIFKVSHESFTFDFNGGDETIEITATSAWTATSSQEWCKLNKTAGTSSEVVSVIVDENGSEARTAVVTFKMGEIEKTLNISQGAESMESILAKERKILEEFYRAAGGDSWTEKNGWMQAEVPLGDWFGVKVYDDGRVKELVLSFNNLKGKITPDICKLKKLKKLEIKGADFKDSSIPENIGDLTELTDLTLKFCSLSGSIPKSIKKLNKLEGVDFASNFLSGNLPEELGEATNLKRLEISRNNFSGSVPDSWKNLTNLELVFFNFNKNITGTIDVFFNLTKLKVLNLFDCGFTGEISTDVKKLTAVETLNLGRNNLTGKLPKEAVSSPAMSYFDFAMNKLNGEIPKEILEFPKMDWTSKWDWNRVCPQQEGYGFSNCPPKPY